MDHEIQKEYGQRGDGIHGVTCRSSMYVFIAVYSTISARMLLFLFYSRVPVYMHTWYSVREHARDEFC